MRYAIGSLPEACFMATGGDPLGALLLALDIERIAGRERYPLDHKFGGPEPGVYETASEPSTSSHPGMGSRAAMPSSRLIDLEDAA